MKPYTPKNLPIKNLDRNRLIGLVGASNAGLAEYNGLMQGPVSTDVLLSPMINQEAVLSSKIEGTQASLEEVLLHGVSKNTDFSISKSHDIQEILNYRTAIQVGTKYLIRGQMDLNLMLKMHKVLMDSVRGANKTPGQFRDKQNWIGPVGSTIESATFVPPSPQSLTTHLNDLQTYLNGEDFDTIVQSGIVHAQFELIHPFRDGNGRVGRLMIPLFLFAKKKIIKPTFYMSEYLEKHRSTYYKMLKDISKYNHWTEWLIFYLNAVVEQSKINTSRTKKIINLYTETKERIISITNSKYSILVLDVMFKSLIFSVEYVCRDALLTKATASNIIKTLLENRIIEVLQPGSGRRPTIYVFRSLLDIIHH